MIILDPLKRKIWTRYLPKTGQTTSYGPGDDGDIKAGWNHTSPRFFTKTIGGDDVVIDRASGLMYPKDIAGPGCNNGVTDIWYNQLLFAIGLSFAGFSDWRITNIYELLMLMDYGAGTFYDIFDNRPGGDWIWSGTTSVGSSADAYWVCDTSGKVGRSDKDTNNYRVIPCRNWI